MSVLGLCLLINDSGLFACISLTALYRIYLITFSISWKAKCHETNWYPICDLLYVFLTNFDQKITIYIMRQNLLNICDLDFIFKCHASSNKLEQIIIHKSVHIL